MSPSVELRRLAPEGRVLRRADSRVPGRQSRVLQVEDKSKSLGLDLLQMLEWGVEQRSHKSWKLHTPLM